MCGNPRSCYCGCHEAHYVHCGPQPWAQPWTELRQAPRSWSRERQVRFYGQTIEYLQALIKDAEDAMGELEKGDEEKA